MLNDDIFMQVGRKILSLSTESTSYERRYKDAARKLNSHLEKLNPEHDPWEALVENSGDEKRNGVAFSFKIGDGRELLDKLLPMVANDFTIFLFKRNGLAINNKNRFNRDGDEWYYVLPACHEGFHRDWKHDCICVKDLPPPKETDD